jgi:hypothetical protein
MVMQVQIGPYKDEGERQEHVVIHHYDTWNMDHTLALIILPMLKQLKSTKHGAPFVDMPDRPEHLQCYKEPEDFDTDKFHFQAWDWAMDEMIWAFEHKVNDDWEEQFFHEDGMEVHIKEIQWKGIGPAQLLLFPDEDGKTEEYEMYEMIRDETPSRFDKEGYNKYRERINNGFRLFGKYYESLWD